MKKLIIFALPVLFIFIGCSRDSMDEPGPSREEFKSSRTVPLKLWLNMAHDNAYGTLCTPENYGVELSGGWVSGHGTHFGNITASGNILYVDACEVTSPTTATGHFSGVLTAANGDQMDYNGVLYFDFTTYTFHGSTEFYNGTGKFEGAYGYVEHTGSVNGETHVSTWVADGTLTY